MTETASTDAEAANMLLQLAAGAPVTDTEPTCIVPNETVHHELTLPTTTVADPAAVLQHPYLNQA